MAATVNWQTKVTPELDEKLNAVTDALGVSKQEYIRVIMAQHLDNYLKAQRMMADTIMQMANIGTDFNLQSK